MILRNERVCKRIHDGLLGVIVGAAVVPEFYPSLKAISYGAAFACGMSALAIYVYLRGHVY